MDESTRRRTILIVAGLVIGGAVVAGTLFMGGRTETILSTVGAEINTPGSGVGSGATNGTAAQPTARPIALVRMARWMLARRAATADPAS